MIKEKYNIINKNCEFDLFAIDCIELSYMLKGDKKINKLEYYIKEYSNDGILTWATFIQECIKCYTKCECCDLNMFIQLELENCIEKFINNYFMEI